MKRERYTIKDNIIFSTLHDIAHIFEENDIPHAVIGGDRTPVEDIK